MSPNLNGQNEIFSLRLTRFVQFPLQESSACYLVAISQKTAIVISYFVHENMWSEDKELVQGQYR